MGGREREGREGIHREMKSPETEKRKKQETRGGRNGEAEQRGTGNGGTRNGRKEEQRNRERRNGGTEERRNGDMDYGARARESFREKAMETDYSM